jgi:RNA polymerase sigma-70 factor (ECF subfamily)
MRPVAAPPLCSSESPRPPQIYRAGHGCRRKFEKTTDFGEYLRHAEALRGQCRGMRTASKPESTGFDPARLIETHQTGVWRYLRAMGCDAEAADDLTQETFLKVLQNPFDDYDRRATAAYLRKVAYHLLVTAKRRGGRVTAVEDIEAFEQLDSRWNAWAGEDEGEALLEALTECLRQLTERARQALQLRFGEKATRARIAASLEITEHGAKNLMQRAKKQLRSCIEGKMR